jgi:hypothetical protein
VKSKFSNICLILLVILLFVACSSEKERLIVGKWSLSGRMIGGTPSSFWFKDNGTVIAPWEKHKLALQSSGTYRFIGDTRIKLEMREGYYRGNVYFFDIVKLDKEELILRNNYEDIRLKRTEQIKYIYNYVDSPIFNTFAPRILRSLISKSALFASSNLNS